MIKKEPKVLARQITVSGRFIVHGSKQERAFRLRPLMMNTSTAGHSETNKQPPNGLLRSLKKKTQGSTKYDSY